MTASLRKPAIHAAADAPALPASAWAPEDLGAPSPREAVPEPAPAAAPAAPEPQPPAERGVPRADVERLMKEAYQRGREEGRRAAEQAERERLQGAVRAAEEALSQLADEEERWAGALEENLCALAVSVARQVVVRELTADPGMVLDLVRRALTEFAVDQPVRVRVNPADLELLTAPGWTTPGAPGVEGRDVRWVADERVMAGGCVVEGRERLVDGRVDTALERIYRRLMHAYH